MAKKMLLMLLLMAVFALSPLACGDGDGGDEDGDVADGDTVDGDDPDGDDPDGDDPDGDDPDGDMVDGDDPDGDIVDGDDPDGDMMDGDMMDGDMMDGDMMDGDMMDGDMMDGDMDFDFDFEMEDDCMEITATYGNIVLEFGSDPLAPVDGAKVTALWNHDGTVIDGVDPVVVGADGLFQFVDLPMCSDGKVAFKVEVPDNVAWVTTYMYEIVTVIPDFPLWAVTYATYIGAPILADVALEAGKSVVAGATYWMEPDGDGGFNTIPIGCSTIESDPAGGVARYFGDNGLPDTIANQTSVNPLNGRYLLANMDPGETAIINKVDGVEVNRTRFVGVGEENSICIASMLLFAAENPENCPVK